MNFTPASRNSDPITSYMADMTISQDGTRLKGVQIAEKVLEAHQGFTSRELSIITGIDNDLLHKRLPDSLKSMKGDKRKCSVTGKMAYTWYLI